MPGHKPAFPPVAQKIGFRRSSACQVLGLCRLPDIFQFQNLQLEILRDADRMLKSGGNLVYSTCTIDPAENEAVVEEFLNQNPGKYQIIPPPESFQPFTVDNKFVRTFPHKHHMEGSFAVKLQKV